MVKPPTKPANGAVGRRSDGKCAACTCPGPATKGTGLSGLPLCTCGHLVACHAGHGMDWSGQPDIEPRVPPRQKYPQTGAP